MAKKVVFAAQIKELKINDKGIVPMFSGAKLVEGKVLDVVNMANNKSDLKITIEAVQAGFFDDDAEPEKDGD